jgi:hypothetical protein
MGGMAPNLSKNVLIGSHLATNDYTLQLQNHPIARWCKHTILLGLMQSNCVLSAFVCGWMSSWHMLFLAGLTAHLPEPRSF